MSEVEKLNAQMIAKLWSCLSKVPLKRIIVPLLLPEYISFKNTNSTKVVMKVTQLKLTNIPAEGLSHTERLKKNLANS